MGSFLLRRSLQLLFVLWGGATLLFLLFYALPTNPAEQFASGGGNRSPDPTVVANLERQMGIQSSDDSRGFNATVTLPSLKQAASPTTSSS